MKNKVIAIRPSKEPPAEPWVDLATVAKHIGFCYETTAKLAKEGVIPSKEVISGRKTYRRFQLSAVDAAFAQTSSKQQAG
jgi:hypothetical protein